MSWLRKSTLATAALVATTAVSAATANATVIIDNNTTGFYNAGLGDLAGDSVLGAQTDASTGDNLFPAADSGEGDPLIPPVATEPNLAGADQATQDALGNFLTPAAGLSGPWSASPQSIPSTWAINDETAIVYTFSLGTAADLEVKIGVDNGIFVWLNGSYLTGALAPGGAFPAEYTASASASAGTNYLQVLREDHGGATGYDIEVTAEPRDADIPAPATAGLLVTGLLALGLHRRVRPRLAWSRLAWSRLAGSRTRLAPLAAGR